MKNSKPGFVVIIAKLGPKFLSLIAKLAKGLKVGKFALAAGSMASYSLVFTWEFALMIMVMLFVHESGHLLAMKQEKMKTKGLYFIPFLGAAAVADDLFPSRAAESYVAFMGPVFGLALTLITVFVYIFTQNPIFAAAASWMALVNLFNLLPINPLDGGRVTKSVAFSVSSRFGLVFLIIGFIVMTIMIIKLKLYLFLILLFVSVVELLAEYHRMKTIRGLEGIKEKLKANILSSPDFSEDSKIKLTAKLNSKDKKYLCPNMNLAGIIVSIFSYILLVLALYLVMYWMKHVPSAEAAMNVLVG